MPSRHHQPAHGYLGPDHTPHPQHDSPPRGYQDPHRDNQPYRWYEHSRVAPTTNYFLDRYWSKAGWPQLADDLWRIAHTDDGRCRIKTPVLGLGLGAALTAELIITGQVDLDEQRTVRLSMPVGRAFHTQKPHGGVVWSLRGAGLVPDRIADGLLLHLWNEPQWLDLKTWITFVALEAPQQVAARLEHDKHVIIRTHTLMGLLPPYKHTDLNVAAWPAIRLTKDAPSRRLDLILLGLCRSMGLLPWVFQVQDEDLDTVGRWPDNLGGPFPSIFNELENLIKDNARNRLH